MESGGPQITRSAKEKTTQAAAAAKLEQFSHTSANSPGRGIQHQLVQAKKQVGTLADRKSSGLGASASKTTCKKGPTGEPPGVGR